MTNPRTFQKVEGSSTIDVIGAGYSKTVYITYTAVPFPRRVPQPIAAPP
jgi:hypothetical protein